MWKNSCCGTVVLEKTLKGPLEYMEIKPINPKGKVKVKLTQSCPTLCDPMGYIVHGSLQAEYWSRQPFPSPGDLPNPRIEPRSPAWQADSLPAEPQRKPKNTGVGSLSLLQRIFLTQGLNWGLLQCRQILYQLSYQGSPDMKVWDCLILQHS